VSWQALLDSLSRTEWVVYAKPPFGGPETVLKYLSRYTHRVAISNRRLLFVGEAVVRFRYRDYADHSHTKEMTLPAREFLRRFLLHVVPRGFMRIRHYGITANRHRARKLARARQLLGQRPLSQEPASEAAPAVETVEASTTEGSGKPPACPACGGPLRVVELIPAARPESALRLHAPHDTS
jgi:hypothetical protein